MQQESFLPTIERTLQLIEMIAKSPQGYSPQELLVLLDVPRSTLFQLLKTLKQMGYLEQSEKRGRYRSGPRLEQWSSMSNPSLAQDIVSSFYSDTSRHPLNETIALLTRIGGQAYVMAQIEAHQQVRSSYSLGPWEADPAILQAIFSPPSGHEIIQHGVAVFSTPETFECAAPICQDGVTPTAAILLTAPRSRWDHELFKQTFCSDVRSMASRLSYQIGAPVYYPYHHTEHTPIQATTELALAEIGAFLQGPWSARLACIRPDGRPHVVPVWQEWDGNQFTILAWKGSFWANYLSENPNVSLTVDEPWPPFHRVVVRGLAQKESTSVISSTLVEGMSQRYMGSLMPDLMQRIECAFRITPEQLKGWKGIAGA
jgi:DNA-binding IclR family transcriptional regulator